MIGRWGAAWEWWHRGWRWTRGRWRRAQWGLQWASAPPPWHSWSWRMLSGNLSSRRDTSSLWWDFCWTWRFCQCPPSGELSPPPVCCLPPAPHPPLQFCEWGWWPGRRPAPGDTLSPGTPPLLTTWPTSLWWATMNIGKLKLSSYFNGFCDIKVDLLINNIHVLFLNNYCQCR